MNHVPSILWHASPWSIFAPPNKATATPLPSKLQRQGRNTRFAFLVSIQWTWHCVFSWVAEIDCFCVVFVFANENFCDQSQLRKRNILNPTATNMDRSEFDRDMAKLELAMAIATRAGNKLMQNNLLEEMGLLNDRFKGLVPLASGVMATSAPGAAGGWTAKIGLACKILVLRMESFGNMELFPIERNGVTMLEPSLKGDDQHSHLSHFRRKKNNLKV
eukprot:g59184.t1